MVVGVVWYVLSGMVCVGGCWGVVVCMTCDVVVWEGG